MSAPDDLAEWVARSRATQGLPQRVEDPDAVSSLVDLVQTARATEKRRRTERTEQSSEPEADTAA